MAQPAEHHNDQALRWHAVCRQQAGMAVTESEAIAVESPLEIRLRGAAFSVTMSTPGEDLLLGRGLLYSEGVVADLHWYPGRCESVDADPFAARSVDFDIPSAAIRLPQTDRRLAATSSCGLCGAGSLAGLAEGLDRRIAPAQLVAAAIPQYFSAMAERQQAFQQAGGTHAAAAFAEDGNCLAVHEDIGRHNAVDKVVGALLQAGSLSRARVLCVSGRISFEIVAKALRSGFDTVAAVSAPSSLAIDLARASGLRLLAFCRGRRCTVYSGSLLPGEDLDVRIAD